MNNSASPFYFEQKAVRLRWYEETKKNKVSGFGA